MGKFVDLYNINKKKCKLSIDCIAGFSIEKRIYMINAELQEKFIIKVFHKENTPSLLSGYTLLKNTAFDTQEDAENELESFLKENE